MDTTPVIAEDAPIGVQLWPTTTPEAALHFTLSEVLVTTRRCRDQIGVTEHTSVTWVYADGKTRNFAPGEKIACRIAPADLPRAAAA